MTATSSSATKAGQVRAALRTAILDGSLAPGEVVDEVATATAHGVSRTPVREALRALTSEGLLVPGARRRLHVVDVSADHRREVVSLRTALEGAAVEPACERRTEEDLDRLRMLVARQRREAKGDDAAAFLSSDEAFHRALAQVAGMPMLLQLLDQLGAFVRLARLGEPTPQRHMLALTREHDRLVDLLEARDAVSLTTTLTEHIRSTAPRA